MKRMAIALRSVPGFTLIEMMIVIAIIGIMVSIAIPNYLVWNQKYQLKEAVGTLHGNIGLARMIATNQNMQVLVTVCQISPCPGLVVNPTPAQVTVFFQRAVNGLNTGVSVMPQMTMVRGISLTNAGGTAVVSPQDVLITPMGRPAPFTSTPGGANNLCIDATGTGIACNNNPAPPAQSLNFVNTNGLNYRIVITSTGKAAWGYLRNLAP